MKTILWNCRGLGGPSTVSQLKDAIRIHLPCFISISETKRNKFFTNTVFKKLGFADRRYTVEPEGSSGGLLLMWNTEVEILQILSSNYCIQVVFKRAKEESKEWLILVWRLKRSCGDFDKRGRSRSQRSCEKFNNFIGRIGMMEIKIEGYPFTWCNNRRDEGFVEEKLDRVFGSYSWLSAHKEAKVCTSYRSSSYHSMLIMDSGSSKSHFFKRFCFDKRWLSKRGCKEQVEKAWNSPVEGSMMFLLGSLYCTD
ncbi:hypothetical protein STAS_21352 [Striga asiatica]|uniref:Uncharacterized protein n=1 Tax=Striga asiatica TaxID=4170 RepID=A0A5A7QGZ5_STRAF|nr:hypothetical protein STAS_21352 [Striga asiatica]